MADFMNEQEIQEAMKRLAENFQQGYITAAEYNKGMKDATIGIRGYTASLQASMAQLGTSMKQLGAGIYKNTQGVGQFGGAIESGADAVNAYTKKFGPAGQAVGMFTQALAKYVAASLKMSDQLFDSYTKISRAGVVGAGAMSEVYDSLRDFGYTMEGLENLGNLLGRNSKNFGLFFQSALQGSRAFGQVASQIQNSDLRQQFFQLGMSVDDINDGIAGYVAQQGKLGQIQGKSVDQLAKGAEAYIKELDILTKLTGMTRQEQEDAREQALQIEAFYAGLADLGEAQQEEALKAFTMMYAKGGPKAAAEMASQFNGVITAASDMFLTTGGASMQAFSKEFFARGGTAAQSAQMIKDSISPDMAKITQDLNKMGVSLGLNFRTIQNLTKDGIVPLEKLAKELTDEQFKQLTGMDKATAAQAGARDSQIKTAQNLQDFVRMGVGPATAALEIFTQAVEYLTSFIPGFESKKTIAARAEAVRTTTASASGTDAQGSMGGFDVPGGAGGGAGAAPGDDERDFRGNLKLKPGAENKGKSSDALYGVAEQVHKMLGGDYKYFSGFNDRDGKSKHASGQAFDLVLNDPSKYESVVSQIKSITGVSFAQFEPKGHKNANGSVSSGDHIHTEVSAAQGAILSGPMGGYKPNLTMHGTEAVVPLNTAAQQAAAGMTDSGAMALQLGKLEEMVSLMKSQLSVSTKIMQYSS
jgi:hypothetical protein